MPELGAGYGVEREHARVRASDVHFAVVDDRLRLLSTLLLAAKAERPDGHQIGNVGRVDLVGGAVALAARAHAPGQYVAAGGRVGLDHRVGDPGAGPVVSSQPLQTAKTAAATFVRLTIHLSLLGYIE